MKTKHTIFLFMLSALSLNVTFGQQVPLFSQYLFNGFLINPAYAGLDGLSAVNLTAREQWIGIPNTPKTHLVSFQTRMLRNSFVKKSASARRKAIRSYTSGRIGIGGLIFNDINANVIRTGGQFTYAYHLRLYNGATMSMALSASLHQFNLRNLNTQQYDPYLSSVSHNMFIPDCGLGGVYSTKKYYAGISIDQLLQSYLKLGKNLDDKYRLYRQYYITGGYRYEIDKLSAVEASTLIKSPNQFRPQLDISCKYIFQRDYWAGLSVRTGSAAALIIMGGLTYERYHFGYAFDYNFNALGRRTWGSHEFMLAYKFGDNASRLRWLNR